MPIADSRQIRRAIPRPVRQLLYDWSPSRKKRWARNPGLERVPTDKGVVLTFDDGPDLPGTQQVLDGLAELQTTATFFVLGEQVIEHRDLTKELLSRGHEIALHGMVHRRHDTLTQEEAREELSRGLEAIEAAVQVRPRWYRPPFGRASPDLVSVCRELDLAMVYWSAWGHDWEPISARRIARIVLRDLDAGSIVLLHDTARHNEEREDSQPTIEALPLIAEAARDAGLPLTSLGAALDGAAG